MKSWIVLFVAAVVVGPSVAFVPAVQRLPRTKAFASEPLNDIKEAAGEYATSVVTNIQDAVDNEAPGFQLLVVGQGLLLLLLLVGDVPLVGQVLEFVSGPGLVLTGAGLLGAGILELGPGNLTPFATPVKDNELKTNGVYALSRHPMYCGLLLAGVGFSVWTNSFQRVIVTGILYLFLDYKASVEESQLAKIHPAYGAYQTMVPKLMPDVAALLENLKDDDDDDDL